MAKWRYIAQRALTGEFLDFDVKMQRDELSWSLSGAGAFRGTVTPDIGVLRTSDGRLLLEEWGTLLYAEADGVIRWGGIVISSSFNDEAWEVEAAGFATYPQGIPFLSVLTGVGVDPRVVVDAIWRHIQSFPDSNLGVEVTGPSTNVRMGVPAVEPWEEVFLDGVWQRITPENFARVIPDATSPLKDAMDAIQTSLFVESINGMILNDDGTYSPANDGRRDHFGSLPVPFTVRVGSEDIIVTGGVNAVTMYGLQRGANGTAAEAHSVGTDVNYTGVETRVNDGEDEQPYELVWWETPDTGAEIDALAKQTPFDYTEHHRWEGTTIRHEIAFHYPRAGRRRDDLAFVQGDNIIETVTPTIEGDDYANEVVGLGSGEGQAVLRRNTAVRDGRLRRVAVYTDKAVGDTARLDSLISAELTWRRNALEISSVVVRDHPNAPIGSWELGDDILVRARLPWLGDVSLWCRIVGWSLVSEDTATLDLQRSDTFHYGG